VTFKGGVKGRLDSFMEENKNLKPPQVEELISHFEQSLERVVAVFGENAFQRWQPEKKSWRNQVLASLYDAQMLGLQNFSKDELENNRDRIVERFKMLFEDADFKQSVDAATNTPSFLKSRVARIESLVKSVLDDKGA
jgi:hypothetical protein